MILSFTVIAVIVLASFVLATLLLKRYAKAEAFPKIFPIISLIRTQKLRHSLDGLAENKWIDRLATLGVILGFGMLAIDFLYARKFPRAKRIIVHLVCFVVLAGFFLIEPLGASLLQSQIYPIEFVAAITIAFALFGFAGFSIVLLAFSAIDIITKILSGTTPCPGVAPIVPGIQFPNVPKEITPPLYIWLTFFILLFVHEISHGILMRKAKVKIKSFGLILLGYLPIGAFAEPDEKQLKKVEPKLALKVYAAGPAANLYTIPIIFVIALLYMVLIFNPFILPGVKQVEAKAVNAIIIGDVNAQYSFCGNNYANPAFGILEKGMIVKAINGTQVIVPSDLSTAKFVSGDNNFLIDINGTIVQKSFFVSDKNQLGLKALQLDFNRNTDYNAPLSYTVIATANNLFEEFLNWLWLLSIAIATANFIPMDPFDGGRMVKILLRPYFGFLHMNKEDTEKFIGRMFLFIVLGLILLNALPLFLVK